MDRVMNLGLSYRRSSARQKTKRLLVRTRRLVRRHQFAFTMALIFMGGVLAGGLAAGLLKLSYPGGYSWLYDEDTRQIIVIAVVVGWGLAALFVGVVYITIYPRPTAREQSKLPELAVVVPTELLLTPPLLAAHHKKRRPKHKPKRKTRRRPKKRPAKKRS